MRNADLHLNTQKSVNLESIVTAKIKNNDNSKKSQNSQFEPDLGYHYSVI